MSTPLDRVPGPDDPSPYAPKWARDGARGPRREPAPGVPDADGLDGDPGPRPQPLEDFSPEPLRPARSLDPTILAEIARVPRARSWLGPLSLIALAVSVAAVVALFVVGVLPPAGTSTSDKDAAKTFLSRFAERTAGTDRSAPAMPQIVVTPGVALAGEGAMPLGVTLNGSSKGAALVITGLPTGATLSAGSAVGTNAWRLSAGEVANAAIRPPRGFAGAMDILVELWLPDGTVVERRSLRFERAAAPAAPRPVVRQLDAEEIAILLKRGEEFIATGDVAAARLVLQRAAEGGDARAALALAGTYDPNMLEQLGVRGFAPDVAMAQAWYERAKELGSAEASGRLERLASRDH